MWTGRERGGGGNFKRARKIQSEKLNRGGADHFLKDQSIPIWGIKRNILETGLDLLYGEEPSKIGGAHKS